MNKQNVQPKKLARVIVIATLDEEFVYLNHRLLAKGNSLTAETIANLAEDNGFESGHYFITVIGAPMEGFVPGEEFTPQLAKMFGIVYEY